MCPKKYLYTSMPLKVHLHIYKYRYIYIAGPWARIFLTNKTQRCIYIYIHRDTHTHIYISYIYTHTYLYICLFFPWKTGSLARGMPEKKCCCIHSGVVPSAAYLADSSWAAHSLVMQVLYSGSRLAFSFSCGACGAVVFVWRCLFRVAFPF